MTDPYDLIRTAIQSGDKARARDLLRPLLRTHPTGEAWYLAARVAASKAQAVDFLHRALMLDPLHPAANRALSRLETARSDTAKPSRLPSPVVMGVEDAPSPVYKPKEGVRRLTAADKRARQRAVWNRIGCFAGILLMFSCSLFALNAVGVIQGVITTTTIATGGPTPVRQVDGIPIEDLPDAAAIVPPSQSEPAQPRDTDILEPGYSHEYVFAGAAGEQVVVYVQFLSVSANRVSRNVAVLDPDGTNIAPGCLHDSILQGDNNVALICDLRASGDYRVRVLGRSGESVGAYFVGVEAMDEF